MIQNNRKWQETLKRDLFFIVLSFLLSQKKKNYSTPDTLIGGHCHASYCPSLYAPLNKTCLPTEVQILLKLSQHLLESLKHHWHNFNSPPVTPTQLSWSFNSSASPKTLEVILFSWYGSLMVLSNRKQLW